MPNVFKNETSQSSIAGTVVYTAPALTTTIILGLNLANTTTSQISASVQVGTTYVVKDAPLPAGSALGVIDGKIIMNAGDTVTVSSSVETAVDVITSVMEQT